MSAGPEADAAPPARRWRRRIAVALACVLALGAAGLLVVRSTWATRRILTTVARAVTGSPDATVDVGSVGGTRLTSLTLREVRVRLGSDEVASVDTLSLSWRLLPLLGRSAEIGHVAASGAIVDLRSCVVGDTWTAMRAGPETDTVPSAWSVRLASLRLARVQVTGGDCTPEGTWSVDDVRVAVSDVDLSAPSATVDELTLAVHPGGTAPDYRADLFFRGALEGKALRVDSLRLESPSSDVVASGLLRPMRAGPDAPDVDFALHAAPIALRDLQPFTDLLRDDAIAHIDLTVTGSAHRFEVDGSLRPDRGGSMDLEAQLVAEADEPLRYHGTATVDAFDPASLLAAGPAGTVDGRVDFDLSGPEPAALSGTSTVRARWVTAPAVTPPGGTATTAQVVGDAEWTNGRAELSGQVAAAGAELTLGGWMTPFDPSRDLDLEGEVRWDRPPEAGTTDGPDHVVARFTVAGSAADPARPNGRVGVEITSSSVRGISAPGGRASLEVREGRGTWRANTPLIDGEKGALGSLEAVGAVDLVDGPELTVDSAVVRDLDLEPLGAPWPTAVHVVLTARRSGPWDDLGSWDVEARLRESTLGPVTVASGSATMSVADDGWHARWRASVLDGTVDGSAHGDLEGGAVDATVTMAEAVVRGVRVDDARVVAAMRGDSLDVSAELSTTAGRGRASVMRVVRAEGTEWRVRDASFAELDLSALADSSGGGTPTSLTGSMEASLTGDRPTTAIGSARFRMEPSTIGTWALDSITVAAEIGAAHATTRAIVRGEGATADVEGNFELADGPPRSDEPDAPPEVEVVGEIRGHGVVREVSIDSAFAAVRYEDRVAFADTMLVWMEGGVLSGRAESAQEDSVRTSDVEVAIDLSSPAALRAWFGLDVTGILEAHLGVVAEIVGDSVSARGDFEGRGLAYGANTLAEAIGNAHGSWTPASGPAGVTAHAAVTDARAGDISFQSITIDAAPEGTGAVVSAEARYDETRRGDGQFWLDLRGDTLQGQVRAFDADVAGQVWRLQAPSDFRVVDGFEVHDLAITSPTGRFTADGVMRTEGEQRLAVALEGVQLEGVSDLLGYEGLEGTVGGSLDVTGTAVAPLVTGAVDVQARLPDTPPAAFSAKIDYGERVLSLDGRLTLGEGAGATVGGRVPVVLSFAAGDSTRQVASLDRDGAVDLRIDVDRLGLQWVEPWLPPEVAREMAGELVADVDLGGTAGAVSLEGGVDLTDAAAYLPGLGLRLREGRFSGRLEGDRLVIQTMEVRAGDGRLTTTGSVRARDLATGELDLHASLHEFPAISTESFRAVLDAELDLGGTPTAPVVDGSVDVLSGDVHLSSAMEGTRAEAVELDDADYEMLAERFGYVPPDDARRTDPSPANAMAMNVEVRLGRDVWVRQNSGPKLSVQFTGELRVEKEANEIERIFGSLEAVPRGSFVEQFGRRFAITSGSVTFNGPPQELQLEVSSEYAIPAAGDPTANEVVIGLGVSGGLEDLSLILSATPEMENSDIVSYLATGRPASQTLQFDSEGTGLVERGANLAIGRASDAVERLAAESTGLDVVQIRTDGANGVTIAAGQYVSPRLYLGFSKPVSFRRSESSSATRSQSPEMEIEYQAFRWLLLNLQREGSRIDFFLRTRYAY